MNDLREQFEGDLNEEDSIKLAKLLFRFGYDNRAEYPQCEKVKSFFICEDTKDGKTWLPVLKLAFHWTKDIDKAFTYIVNSVNSHQEFKSNYANWQLEKNKPK